MPKPQRREKYATKSSSSSNETLNLTKEVKRIKLSRVNSQVQLMDCSPAFDCDNAQKRPVDESLQSASNKRPRIQWP